MIDSLPAALGLAIGIALLSAAASWIALVVLRRRGILDRPNPRSSHRRPVPRGGGIGFMAVILVALAVASVSGVAEIDPIVIGAAFLIAAVSFADDLRSLPRALRFAFQLLAVLAGLLTIPGGTPVLGDGVPLWLDRMAVGLAWLWFLNLFNFMDGIDGIAGGETAVIGVGVAALALLHPALAVPGTEAVIIAAAAAGFLTVNWPPARLFMGDVGSIGLGYLLGWLLIDTAAAGLLAAALVLPLVFVADATTTLIGRALRGRPLATAHRDHAYQAAVDRGWPHWRVTGAVLLAGVALILLAVLSVRQPAVAIAAAVVLTAALLAWLRWGQRGGSSGTSSR